MQRRGHGVIVNVSIWGQKAEIDMLPLVMKEIRLTGSFAYQNDHAPVIELLKVVAPELLPLPSTVFLP